MNAEDLEEKIDWLWSVIVREIMEGHGDKAFKHFKQEVKLIFEQLRNTK